MPEPTFAIEADTGAPVLKLTLLDTRRTGVVPQVVANEFARILEADIPSKRIAVLASGAPHRRQEKRIMDDRCRLFDTEDEARSWLFAD